MRSIDIEKALLSCGLKPNVKGFSYCADVVAFCKENGLRLKRAYEVIAKNFGIKPNSIEKSVSNAIERGFLNIEVQRRFERLTDKNAKLTNKKFVKYVVERLKE